MLFTVAFSFIANFGILSRQRVLVLPAVLVLAALPPRLPASVAGGRRPLGEGDRARAGTGAAP